MRWFRRPTPEFIAITPARTRDRIAKDVWHKCDSCGRIIRSKDWQENYCVCPSCGRHDRISAAQRIHLLADPGTFEETEGHLAPSDPLGFEDTQKYRDRVESSRRKTQQRDAVMTGRAAIGDVPVAVAAMDFFFMGGSMGCVVGEKIARCMEMAIEEKRTCITVVSTGGARMQEGILSLMQLAKTAILCKRMQEVGIPYLSILSDPSTAGVMASFGSLGDLILAEPQAYVGFAGRRVIEQTIRQSLPPGFQTAEFVQEHGFIDLVVSRHDMRKTLIKLLRQINGLETWSDPDEAESVDVTTAGLTPES